MSDGAGSFDASYSAAVCIADYGKPNKVCLNRAGGELSINSNSQDTVERSKK